MDPTEQALVTLGRELRACDYHFTTITPATHSRVISRVNGGGDVLARVFGWSRCFQAAELPNVMLALLDASGELEREGELFRSKVRFSSLGPHLLVHSAFPTEAADSVFFGPDTYRFVRALRQALQDFAVDGACTVIDIGSGTGAGGLCVADLLANRAEPDIVLADINPKALRYCRVNASLNGVARVRTALSDVFSRINEGGNLIISNPPYLLDAKTRAYRNGGGALGIDLALRIAEEGLERLYPGGRLFVYTGTPIVAGADQFFASFRPRLDARRVRYSYEEIDPDVFGEELDTPAYAHVERIAVVALTVDI